MVVIDGEMPGKGGKFLYQDVLLEGTYLPAGSLADSEAVLASYHTAHALATGVMLDDPTGWLEKRMTDVRRQFPHRSRVEARSRTALDASLNGLAAPASRDTLALQAQSWVFPTGITTHALLVAGLRNPTVRRRYETTRALLAEHGRLDLHEHLLGLLGSERWTPAEAERHLEAVARLYDAAIPVDAPGYRFAGDVTALARPISIDGSRDMIARGYHREAAFWLVVAGSRALQKLAQGQRRDLVAIHESPYRALLAGLGIATDADFLARRDRALALLPEVDRAAQAIMDATPEIVGDEEDA